MNLQQLNELDLSDIASWPAAGKAIIMLVICALFGAGGYYLFISDSIQSLDKAKAQETQLKSQFEVLASQASNLNTYKAQMVELEKIVQDQLKQLPNKNEVAGLLDDISYIATNHGLTLTKINWEPEVKKDFYTELPMRIELEGDYSQLGEFAASIAALPRIVVLGSFTINKGNDTETLKMSVQAKTYRYDPESENVKDNKKGKAKKGSAK